MTLPAMACCATPRGRLDIVVVSRRGFATAPSSALPDTPRNAARYGRAESDMTS
jgi:hypothetical protein